MIITNSAKISRNDTAKYCWSGLRRYQNVAITTNIIAILHSIPKLQQNNVAKQAEQIRFCLIQAKEYYDAACSVSLATKPTLLYYSLMSLALAEILLKQDGNSSLDRAREHHRHHGLSLQIKQLKKGEDDLTLTASALKAIPLIKSGGARSGTFELWHRSSRELPICGKIRDEKPDGSSTTSYGTILGPLDQPLPSLPGEGISLQEALMLLPSMRDFMCSYGLVPHLVRGTVSVRRTVNQHEISMVIHPYAKPVLDKFYSNVLVKTDCIEQFSFKEVESGIILKFWTRDDYPVNFELPPAFMSNKEEVIFLTTRSINSPLNEFGLFYVALYIAGNYARYFPDKWMQDVEQNSPLALAVEHLIAMALERVPLLSFSEMSQTCLVTD